MKSSPDLPKHCAHSSRVRLDHAVLEGPTPSRLKAPEVLEDRTVFYSSSDAQGGTMPDIK